MYSPFIHFLSHRDCGPATPRYDRLNRSRSSDFENGFVRSVYSVSKEGTVCASGTFGVWKSTWVLKEIIRNSRTSYDFSSFCHSLNYSLHCLPSTTPITILSRYCLQGMFRYVDSHLL